MGHITVMGQDRGRGGIGMQYTTVVGQSRNRGRTGQERGEGETGI